MINESYLNDLIHECNELRKNTAFRALDTETMRVSYMPKKIQGFVGYLHGYYELSLEQKHKIKESGTLRTNCKNYLKIYRDDEGTIQQIESYVNGRTDVIHQLFEKGNKTFLFPFTSTGGSYPTYTYVTVYSGDEITEEYLANRNQIVYMRYEPDGNDIGFSSVNYVEGGRVPILESRRGIIHPDTLQYNESEYNRWDKA